MNRTTYIRVLVFLTVAAVILVNGCGGGSPGSPPSPPQIAVTISPTTASVPINTTQQFTDTVTGTSNTAVTWSVNGVTGGNSTVGTILSTGLFTAPGAVPSPATVTVTVTSQADTSKSASASVTITGPPPPPGMRNVSVTAGTMTSGVDIAVQQLTPTLVLRASGIGNSAGAVGVEVARGASPRLLLVGQGVVPGTSYQISGPNDVQVTQPSAGDFTQTTDGTPAVHLNISVSLNPPAALGPRNIMVTNSAGEISVLVGALLVTP